MPVTSPEDYQRAHGAPRPRHGNVVFLAPNEPTPPSSPPTGQIATADFNGFYGIPGQLAANTDEVLALYSDGSFDLYRAILSDPQAHSAFQQRRRAVVQRPWKVDAGATDATAEKAADALRDQINALDWDGITNKMLYGVWYGYSVGELVYEPDGGLWAISDIIVPKREAFKFTPTGELRYLPSNAALQGVPVPPRKFWTFRSGDEHSFEWYGKGLAHFCYWPWFYKRGGWRYWARYLEKYSAPTAIGKYPEHLAQDSSPEARAAKAALLSAVRAVHVDAGIITSKETEIELLESARSGADYQAFKKENDDDLSKVILSQTMTTDAKAAGLGSQQAKVHEGVKDEVVRADSDLLTGAFNRGPSRWWTDFNFGPDVAAPVVYREMEDPEDVDDIAARDKTLFDMGYRRTEESFREVYGDGYERKEEEPPELVDPNNPDGQRAPRNPAFLAGDPKPLYVKRDVVNAREIIAWAQGQGIPNLLPANELHVTIAYSRRPVDWMQMGTDFGGSKYTINEGGPRQVERFAEGGPVVLLFLDDGLKWRNEGMRDRGASWDHDDYRPHISLTYDPGDLDLTTVEPYRGKIVLGPEVFEDLDDDWQSGKTFAAEVDGDAIDRIVAALTEPGQAVFAEIAAEARDAVAGAATLDAARIALLDVLERLPTDKLGEVLGRAGIAARAAAQAGVEDEVA